MVNSVTDLGRNGIQDWLILRITAILIMLYIFYILGFILISGKLTYDTWHNFFSLTFTKVFTLLTLFAVLLHGWIGIWQVLTDYIKYIALRLIGQVVIVIFLLACATYGTLIVWSV
ncbi:succinate dehydrogenase, hydrophobic membrane anchor protein [Candidatus Ishikawella capsulata]|uniref:Succinate dehydrogenase hydrophobic membrane anchor subunit n=1 Tax=Candidatus Ishikawaella capsulata Mpkobe TaxID=476281 RepID=C5WDD3_9ENTR|nr:succinate dehydrogenase, hydrophobic membrane anchor protein [Candidatus Ishikawaella capsulata]BAH83339.1 succinate dehydrogenase cytochrome b556 small membrane subunit [Candidatus Ishikawaella capsulata Mpkobe]